MVGGKSFLLGERSLLFVEVDRERCSIDGDVELPVRSRLVQSFPAMSWHRLDDTVTSMWANRQNLAPGPGTY